MYFTDDRTTGGYAIFYLVKYVLNQRDEYWNSINHNEINNSHYIFN